MKKQKDNKEYFAVYDGECYGPLLGKEGILDCLSLYCNDWIDPSDVKIYQVKCCNSSFTKKRVKEWIRETQDLEDLEDLED